jgi:hypothetical protein
MAWPPANATLGMWQVTQFSFATGQIFGGSAIAVDEADEDRAVFAPEWQARHFES